jgi:hypothetical protein
MAPGERRGEEPMIQITREDVVTTYAGLQGCACGCGGTYQTEGPAVTRRVNKVNRALAEGTAHVQEPMVPGGEYIYSVEGETRATRVYTTRAAEEEEKTA